MPWEETENEIRQRIADPDQYDRFGRRTITRGVSLLVCRKKDGSGWINQALRFDKGVFPTIAAAKVWFNEHWVKRNEKVWDLIIEGIYSDEDIKLLGLEVEELENLYPEEEKELDYWLHQHVVDNATHQVLIIGELDNWDIPIPRAVPPESLDWPITSDRQRCEFLSEVPQGTTLKDEGKIHLGARKSDFYEYFLADGQRVLFKRIVVEDTKDAMSATLEKLEVSEEQKELIMFDLDMRYMGEKEIWITWLSDDNTPYVLSKRAVESNWIPPFGHSALPLSFKEGLSERYHYWKEEDHSKRLNIRNSLVSDRDVKLNVVRKYDDIHYLAECEEGFQFLVVYKDEQLEDMTKANCKELTLVKKLKTMEFTLIHHFWRGQFALSARPATEHWDLFIGDGLQVVMPKSPLRGNTIASTRKPYIKKFMHKGKKGLEFIKPGRPGNPTASTPSYVERVDSGTVTILEECNHVKRYEINGRKLKGLFTLERKDIKRNKWQFSGVKVPSKDVKLSASQSVKSICLAGELQGIKELEDGTLEVSSVTLGEGVWNGDYYSSEAIKDRPERIVGAPILVGPHSLEGKHGVIKSHSFDGRDLSSVGHITQEDGIKKLKTGDFKGPSVEVNVIIDEERHIIEKILKYTRVNYVENPACEVCNNG